MHGRHLEETRQLDPNYFFIVMSAHSLWNGFVTIEKYLQEFTINDNKNHEAIICQVTVKASSK